MISGRGLVCSMFFVRPGTQSPDLAFCDRVVVRAIQKGVMLFITGNGSIKICPPLTIPEEPLIEGAEAIGEAIAECIEEGKA